MFGGGEGRGKDAAISFESDKAGFVVCDISRYKFLDENMFLRLYSASDLKL